MGLFNIFKGTEKDNTFEAGLMNKLRTENWSRMTYDQRWDTLQKIENSTAEREGRTARTVWPERMEENVYGYFSEKNPYEIHVNNQLLANSSNGYEMADTVWHEGRHAYQYDACNGELRLDSKKPDAQTTELWKANFYPGIYREEGGGYYYQPVEMDAKRFAADRMQENEKYFSDDPGYTEYQNEQKGIRQAYDDAVRESLYGSPEFFESVLADDILETYHDKLQEEKDNQDVMSQMAEEQEKPELFNGIPPDGKEEMEGKEGLAPNTVMVNASDIDMSYARGVNDSDEFWNHHGSTKDDYMRIVGKLPEEQQEIENGRSIEDLKNDPELGEGANAYYNPENMVRVNQSEQTNEQENVQGKSQTDLQEKNQGEFTNLKAQVASEKDEMSEQNIEKDTQNKESVQKTDEKPGQSQKEDETAQQSQNKDDKAEQPQKSEDRDIHNEENGELNKQNKYAEKAPETGENSTQKEQERQNAPESGKAQSSESGLTPSSGENEYYGIGY